MHDKASEVLEHALAKVGGYRRKSQLVKTETEVFDEPTLMTLYKLINNGTLTTLDFPISTGKEANVYQGTSDVGSLAVKIYRVPTSTFNAHLQYIIGDHRFSNIRPTKRNIVSAWAQKEHRNLLDMLEAGFPVPTPVAVRANVVVMEYIGTERGPAPTLRDVMLEDPAAAVETMSDWLTRLWQDVGLVHGDLSEFNVLVAEEGLVLMDVGQAVPRKHPRALELLERDAVNIVRYGKRVGVDLDVKDLLGPCLDGLDLGSRDKERRS